MESSLEALIELAERAQRGEVKFGPSPVAPMAPPKLPALPTAAEPLEEAEAEHDSFSIGKITPPVPDSLEEAGLAGSLVEQLILKYLYFRGELLGRDIASLMGLSFSVIESTIDTLKRQHFLSVKSSLGMGIAKRARTFWRRRVAT